MNDGDNSHRYRFQTLPGGPVSVKREAEEDGEEAAVGQAFTIRHSRSSSPSVLSSVAVAGAESASSVDRGEQEEALVALVEFRSKEVERLRQRLEYYKSQLEDAERKLSDSKSKLARLRSQPGASSSLRSSLEPKGAAKPCVVNGGVTVKEEKSPTRGSEQLLRPLRPQPSAAAPPPERQQPPPQLQSRPPLIIPAVRPKPVPPSSTDVKVMGRAGRPEAMMAATSASVEASSPGGTGTSASPSCSSQPTETTSRLKRGAPSAPSPENGRAIKNSKTKFVQKEHMDLVSSVRRSSSPSTIRFQPGVHISSQHKRKLRCLEINPVQDQLFVTSALDGVVNLWQLQPKGSGASLISTTDCLSPKQRRWPEDIAWHPGGDRLFSVYTADGGDAQISILNLNSSSQKRVTFLPEKPHVKGIINSIQFLPMADFCFVTGGSDHAVILWHEGDGENEWKPKSVHRNIHSSAVMGVAGLQQKKIVLSVGVDKRIIGFDLLANRADFKHQVETKCLSVLPNPSDFNLFMVQSGTPGKQLRLFDIRLRQTELHSFGWKQESSESQSALINQAWSPDGLYITSGSADPVIHIFDIRYNSHNPSQSVQAHQKRVFKAAWHQSLPFLISISSDLNVGVHKRA